MRRTAKSVMTALVCLTAPMRRPRPMRWAPAESRRATVEALDRVVFGEQRTAIVLSLWAAKPAGQCVATAHYDLAPGTADFSRVLNVATAANKTAAPAGARALWARLQSSGISAAAPSSAATLAPMPVKEASRRAA